MLMTRLIALFLLFLTGSGLPATAAPGDCVLLIHGLGRTPFSLLPMRAVLESHGYHVVSVGYPSTSAPVETLAAETLPPAFAACGNRTVHAVTHSMGGILLRTALTRTRPDRLGRVVMLAPPNQGSQLVDMLGDMAVFGWFGGPAGAQLGTGPASLPRSLPPVDYPVGVIAGAQTINPYFSSVVQGPDDGKIAVAETRVAGMTSQIVLPATHTFMMNNPRVIAQTISFLETGHFSPGLSWSAALADLTARDPVW